MDYNDGSPQKKKRLSVFNTILCNLFFGITIGHALNINIDLSIGQQSFNCLMVPLIIPERFIEHLRNTIAGVVTYIIIYDVLILSSGA